MIGLLVRIFKIAPRCPGCGRKMYCTSDRYWFCLIRKLGCME